MTRAERLAHNEAMFREVNERISEVGERFGLEKLSVMCECSDPECVAQFQASPDEYAALRASSIRFGVLPGHERPDVERVVARNETHLVIEKTGEGAQVADADASAG